MPISPSELEGQLSFGEQLSAGSIESAIDAQLTSRYTGTGHFESDPFTINASDRVVNHIINRYKAVGWKGAYYYWDQNKLYIVLRIRQEEQAN